MRVAMLGGSPGHYSEVGVTTFLQKLRVKYPDVHVVTGSAKGAEAQVREWLALVGQPHTIPPLYEAAFGKEALLLQVTNIVLGANVIAIMGTPTGGRAKFATDIWHRMNLHKRNERGGLLKVKGEFVSGRVFPEDIQKLVYIAPPATKSSTPPS